MYAVFIFNVYDNIYVTVINYCIVCMQYFCMTNYNTI